MNILLLTAVTVNFFRVHIHCVLLIAWQSAILTLFRQYITLKISLVSLPELMFVIDLLKLNV